MEIVVDESLRADDAAGAVARLVVQRGRPEAIKVDNGSEFVGKVMDRWAYENGVELYFPRRGSPTDNAMVASFNGRMRQECLNEHWFLSLADARSKVEAWRRLYNEERPHGALAWKTLRNSPENTGPKRIPWRQKRANLYRLVALLLGGSGI